MTLPNRNTGFLRYWTVSNLPLFALAAPMLFVLVRSGIDVLRAPSWIVGGQEQQHTIATSDSKKQREETAESENLVSRMAQRMALVQVVLALLAATSYHVQIITRLSSGYPVWYWWLARELSKGLEGKLGRRVLMFMVTYALIQGALFASFLPPA